ncbi:MAG: HEAT repeat domain-containing protein [Candidatus Micrarchaeota archaeon]
MDSVTANINKLVSLTFDERPEVRKQAAKSLSEVNDPGAMLALVELGFDKDPSVREVAQHYLDKKRKAEPELMSFATIFSKHQEEGKEEKEEPAAEAKEKMLRPITQIFERRLGKEKAEMARSKLMPSIEKVYLKAHQVKKKNDDSDRKVMQEFLTNYLEVMSDLDRIGGGAPQQPVIAEPHEHGEAHEPEQLHEPEGLSAELESVGKSAAESDKLSTEASSLELSEIEEIREREEVEKLPDTFFKKAYESMMLSEGDEDVMKQEMNRMIEDARREIGLAFRLAKKRFKEMKITNITKIRDGMRNINTDMLVVRSVEALEYQKTKKVKATATRVMVNDETGNEGVVYLFDGRGTSLQSGMRIKVVRGLAKAFEFSGETALTLGKKGNVYIVL